MKSMESKGEPETTTEMMGKKQVQRERREPSFSEYLTLVPSAVGDFAIFYDEEILSI
eukprot:jgi/Bigna1/62359/fgenesh1_kg.34_\